MGLTENLGDTTKSFIAILSLGLVGLLFLIIFGNLSGNLGFGNTSVTFNNETINLTAAGEIPASADNRVNGALSSIVITNSTDGEIVQATNYTATGVTINATTASVQYFHFDVNVTATVTFDSTGKVDSNNVISNLTGGAVTFFTFSNVWFVLLAITLLIIIVISVIAIVSKSTQSSFSS